MHGSPEAAEAFIARWSSAGGTELANYQLFLTELSELLGLPRPDPAGAEHRENAYVFERGVTFRHGDGTTSAGRIDLYRRGCFVCEAKRVKQGEATKGFDDALLRARSQAESYARALPADEGRPPFLMVVDVGRVIELYSEFSRSGATYVPFPDPRSHRIPLDGLRDPAIRERLAGVWIDPLGLDPSRRSAKVTREIAARLAEVAKSLEASGHGAEAVGAFLSRCLFTFFAEDIGLLPKDGFRALLERHADDPPTAMRMVAALWREMDSGGFSVSLAVPVLRFNGKLFKQPDVLPLNVAQIGLLIEAAKAQWSEVEPAIFGTLLERALDPQERHALGAHYTPRAYVERLVLPTVIEPLREDWSNAKAAALTLAREDDLDGALQALKDFHHALCQVRVLDPACGSGNFLYVTLEHLKRLEGEVLNTFDELDPARQRARLRQQGLALDGGRADPFGGETVDPHQLLGIEVNPRAAAIAEMVLWIGYLQWHYRTCGNVNPPEPVLRDFRNIECRDAVLTWDRIEFVADEHGRPITRWDGKTMKPSPITGELIPDDSARVPVERYVNPRKAEWPVADFVVGNPPFIGNKRMRIALGDGYVEALRAAWPEVAESADFVMFWWEKAALICASEGLKRFGLIATNSLRQFFNRRVLERHVGTSGAVRLVLAIPDHPWVDAHDGAAVRISMTVAEPRALPRSPESGSVWNPIRETEVHDDEIAIEFSKQTGVITASLRAGADPSQAPKLRSNAGLCGQGVKVVGDGFYVDDTAADEHWASGPCISMMVNARDVLSGRREGRRIIDFFGLDASTARNRSPAAYQQVVDRVKPVRDQNARQSIREIWWRFAWERPVIRRAVADLSTYMVTLSVAKHRFFARLPAGTVWDGALFAIALDDSAVFGVLSSRIHCCWALAAGGTLEDRPTWTNSTCFDAYPFPDLRGTKLSQVAEHAVAIETHRLSRIAAHSELTVTDIYNVVEKLRRAEPLTAKDKVIHDQGLVSVLRELHDDLDRAVFAAYGWDDLAEKLVGKPGATTPWPEKPAEQAEAEEELLSRLVALNAERAAEEARGIVRWLRPDFQNPQGQPAPPAAALQDEMSLPEADNNAVPVRGSKKPKKRRGAAALVPAPEAGVAATSGECIAWPKTAPEQARAVAELLTAARTPLTLDDIAARFTARGRWRERLPQLLDTLVALGRARVEGDRWRGGM
jgi:hypothetical protein